MKHSIVAAALALAAATAGAQIVHPAAKPPLSQALQDYFVKQITDWDRAAPTPADPNRTFADMDFRTKVQPQLAQAGTAAAPIAPRLADLMQASEKNRYTLGYLLMGMTPQTADADVARALQDASGSGGGRLLAYARLGRASSRDGLQALGAGARAPDLPGRMMATIALAYVGASFPGDVAQALAANLKDEDKGVRFAAINGLRLIGGDAAPVAPQVIDFLRTRENPWATVRVLKNLPLESVRPARADLEAIVADPKLSTFQKEDSVALLMRLELGK